MRTVRTKVYSFNELTPAAQQVALRNFEPFTDHIFEDATNTLNKFCEIFSISFRQFSFLETYRNDYRINLEDEILQLSGQRLATYIWNNYRTNIFRGKYYGKLVKTEKDGSPIKVSKLHPAGLRHVERYSKCTLKNECVLTGVCYDYSILNPIYNFLNKPTNINFEELIEECLQSICKDVESEYEFNFSDEAKIDSIEANSYEFTANGLRF